jgi:Putative restriction endonuclease
MPPGGIVFDDRLRIPADVFELERFRAWAHSDAFPENGKVSYLSGEIEVEMSPEELNSHGRVKRDVSTDLHVLARKLDLGEVFFDGTFLVNQAAEVATEPDLMFCTWSLPPRSRGAGDWSKSAVRRISSAKSSVTLRSEKTPCGCEQATFWRGLPNTGSSMLVVRP